MQLLELAVTDLRHRLDDSPHPHNRVLQRRHHFVVIEPHDTDPGIDVLEGQSLETGKYYGAVSVV